MGLNKKTNCVGNGGGGLKEDPQARPSREKEEKESQVGLLRACHKKEHRPNKQKKNGEIGKISP